MKVKKQGWINIYKDLAGNYFTGSAFVVKEDALKYWDSLSKLVHKQMKRMDTIQIEWEEEE